MARFPSVDWFEAVARALAADRERLRRLGYVDATVGVRIDDGSEAIGFVLEFGAYGVKRVRQTDTPEADADFTIAGSAAAWREMVENIRANGEADLNHTLNRLTMAGTPLKVVAADQLQEDLFFRFNQSLQALFDASASVETAFGALAPA